MLDRLDPIRTATLLFTALTAIAACGASSESTGNGNRPGATAGSNSTTGGTSAGGTGNAPAVPSSGGSNTSAGSPGTSGSIGAGAAPSTGGAPGGSGAPSNAGATAAGGTAGAGPTNCTPNPPAQACSGTAAPSDGVVVDFATYLADGSWGLMTQGDLTGGTSPYGTPAITRTVQAGALHMQVTLATSGYSGFVLWFGPCVNASAYTGVTLTAGGTLGGAALKLQVQTHVDYPVDVAHSKGGCIFANCATMWSECVGPTTSVAVPATLAQINLPWSAFVAGKPTAAVTPEGVVGLQFQFECPAAAGCAVDMTLGTIGLLPP